LFYADRHRTFSIPDCLRTTPRRTNMSVFTVTRTLKHPVKQVWALLDDFGGIHRWSAGVKSSPINAGTPEHGVGSERHCSLYDGNSIQERVTESVDQQRLALEVFKSSMPLKRGSALFELAPTAEGGTQLSMTFDYDMKYGILGKAMDALMVRKSMEGSLTRLLAALDEHLATGDLISEGWTPVKAAV
jgi:uncharacterized protein YndB with AHSA1/START domain